MECIDLTSDITFLTTKNLNKRRTSSILNLWKLRNLSIKGRIVVFKSLAISKLTHLRLVTEIRTWTINLLTKIQMEFFWKRKTPNIESSNLCNDSHNDGLKNVDVSSKIVSSQSLG